MAKDDELIEAYELMEEYEAYETEILKKEKKIGIGFKNSKDMDSEIKKIFACSLEIMRSSDVYDYLDLMVYGNSLSVSFGIIEEEENESEQ